MGRFSPTVQQMSPLAVLSGGIDAYADGREERRRREEEEERNELDRVFAELELHGRGVRTGPAPRERVPEAQRVDRDAQLGMAAGGERAGGIFTGARPGMASGMSDASHAEAVLEQARRLGPTRGTGARGGGATRSTEPRVVHPAGSYVRGVGFTEKTLTDLDPVEHSRARAREAAGPRMRDDPSKVQLTDERYLDTDATPDAIARQGQEHERSRAARALGALGLTGPAGAGDPDALLSALDAGVPSSVLFPEDEEEPRARTGIVRSGNRNVLSNLETGDVIEEYDELPAAGGRDGAERGLPASVALDVLDRQYGIWEPNSVGEEELVGYEIDDAQLYQQLLGMVRGESIDFERMRAGGSRLSPSQEELFGRMMEQARRQPGVGSRGGATPSDDAVRAALAELGGLPREQAEQILREEGATAEQIRRIGSGG